MISFLHSIDFSIFWWLNSWVGISHLLDTVIIFHAVYLMYVVVVALFLFAAITWLPRFRALREKNIRLVCVALVSAVVARFAITEYIRFLHNRQRPFEALQGVHQLIAHESGGSFPSGHASFAFAIATVIAYYYPKTSVLFFLAAFSMSVARIAAGVHWPSDIVGGLFAGLLGAVVVQKIAERIKKPSE